MSLSKLAMFGLLAATVACGGGSRSGGNDGGDGTATVGAAGGTVSLSTGPSVQVPGGALTADKVITLRASSATPPTGALTAVYEFAPAGTTFSTPITVTFTVPAGTSAASIYWTKAGSSTEYESLPTTISGTTATAQVTHFSSGFVGAACAAGTACTPANRCHQGTTTCNGAPACADLGTNVAEGTACCSGGTCTNGFCQASTFDGSWRATAMQCGGAPALASWIAPPSVFRVTQSGATGYSIWTDGSCVVRQLQGVVGTIACTPSAAACQSYTAAVFGGQICGASYDDTTSVQTLLTPIPACSGGSVTVRSTGSTPCPANGELTMTFVRE